MKEENAPVIKKEVREVMQNGNMGKSVQIQASATSPTTNS
jgi:hypothetical protein